MMPNGTAHTAMSNTAHFGAPRARIRASAIAQAITMPRMMNSAYARTGTGPISHAAVVGLGIEARGTGHNATWPRRVRGLPLPRRGAPTGSHSADAGGQISGQGSYPG